MKDSKKPAGGRTGWGLIALGAGPWQGGACRAEAGRAQGALAWLSALPSPHCCCPRHAHPAVTPRSRAPHPAGRSTAAGARGVRAGRGVRRVGDGGRNAWRASALPPKMEGPPTPHLHGPSGEAEPGGMGSSEAAGAPVCPAHSGSFAPWGHSASGWSAAGGHGQGGLCFLVAGDVAGSDQSSSTCWRGPRAGPPARRKRWAVGGPEAGRRRAVGGSEAGRRRVGGGL